MKCSAALRFVGFGLTGGEPKHCGADGDGADGEPVHAAENEQRPNGYEYRALHPVHIVLPTQTTRPTTYISSSATSIASTMGLSDVMR